LIPSGREHPEPLHHERQAERRDRIVNRTLPLSQIQGDLNIAKRGSLADICTEESIAVAELFSKAELLPDERFSARRRVNPIALKRYIGGTH
jgi:hypothetical protein